MSQNQLELFKKFVQDPDWQDMEDIIFSEFEVITDVSDIDTKTSSEVVHAEVIARARIKRLVGNAKTKIKQLQFVKPVIKNEFR